LIANRSQDVVRASRLERHCGDERSTFSGIEVQEVAKGLEVVYVDPAELR
jgi:hypothetical protein